MGLATVTPDTPSSAAVTVDGKTQLVVTRTTIDGIGFSLVRPASSTVLSQRPLLLRILVALILGMTVAAIAAVMLARRLARPLRDTARVATSMAHGQRDLRVTVGGPLEVADVATAVNSLADSLYDSEQRQRNFLLSVSHELRTPLTAVSGFAESLADGVVTGDDVPAVARIIASEAGRLDRLVSDLLDLARLGADDFRLELAPIDVATAPLIVRTDPRRLRQFIDGLADNAVRLTPPGSQVVIALYATPGHAVIQVRDAGPGLSSEDYPVAFQRGALRQRYEGHRRVGTGIGPSLVEGLVIRLDATISAGPAPEGGASFTVVLPLDTTP